MTMNYNQPKHKSFRCLIVIFFLNFVLSMAEFHFSNETDHQALLAFKNSITNDPFNVLKSWNNSLDFCQWEGITCGTFHRRVTAISLPSQSLGGNLSPHVGNLTFLKTINLGSNSFQGPIPPEIGYLFRLKELILSNNSFHGDFPKNLSYCSNMVTLDFGRNNLEGEIPSELGSLFSLSFLNLESNKFKGKIPSSLGNLSNLREITLELNHLEGNIPLELSQLFKLEKLQLSQNRFVGSIPSGIFNLSSVTAFSVVSNFLTGSLPETLGLTLPRLLDIHLANNSFHGPIPSSLVNASRLAVLEFGLNLFSGTLPKNYGSLYNLEYIYFGLNSLQGDISEFIQSLSNCSKLRTLKLGSNPFGGEFPRSVANLSKSLTWFDLFGSNITGNIPKEIGELTSVQYFDIDGNILTGDLPYTIGNMVELQEIYFYGNQISGRIPSSFGNLTQLTILSGSNNMLEGTIPNSLGNCSNLWAVDLEWNNLSGPIPKSIFDTSSLYELFLSKNILTGMLPMEVGRLKNLAILDVSLNNFSGAIPASLGSCQVLEKLNMSGNAFNGSIPPSFSQLKSIRILDLSNNSLSGSIPVFLTEFTFQILNLSYNYFEGEVPSEGVFGNISSFSVVGNKNLCGGIKDLGLLSCPHKNLGSRRKQINFWVIIPIATVLPVVFLLLLFLLCNYYIRRRSKQAPSSTSILQEKFMKISYTELLAATGGFSSSNLVGQGRYGSVYKGTLNITQEVVAVKVLNLQQQGAEKSFLAECEALKSIRHRNLVKIITSCSSIDSRGQGFKALVYEFMANGNLESWLHPSLHQEPKVLSFLQRLDIAIDVATALDYLHNYCEPAIVHCDIKPSNILLDDDLYASVSDFGLAKILSCASGESDPQSSCSSIRGTIGYVAPEYGMNLEVSKDGDMYSYGILLLEMFTGKSPMCSSSDNNTCLHNYVKMYIPNRGMAIVDPHILREFNEEALSTDTDTKLGFCVDSILQIGVLCSKEQAKERMGAENVLVELRRIRNAFI